jgi:hypothetical protein
VDNWPGLTKCRALFLVSEIPYGRFGFGTIK